MIIPQEVLLESNVELFVGVLGTNISGIVLPTVWINLGKIEDGASLGSEENPSTPDIYNQILDAANSAKEIAMEIRQDAESGKFNGEAATIKVGTVTSGELPQVENEGTLQDAIFNFVLPRGEQGPVGPQGPPGADGQAGATGPTGADGQDGQNGQDGITPTIGENGNWFLGDTDTGKPSRGEIGLTGPVGPQGEPGKDGVQIDDTAVSSTETWSSRKIIDTLCLEFSVSGNPVTCTPIEGYPLGVAVTMGPIQEGTGDPSPDNVRPITGRDCVKVTVSNESESRDYDLTLPETIYGGSVDAVTGVGSEEWAFVEFDGTENWEMNSNNIVLYNAVSAPANTNPGTGYCSHFPFAYNYGGDNIFVSSVHIYLGTALSEDYSIETWKAYLVAQKAAGTPVTICYQLATPTSIQATGNQQIKALSGINTLVTTGDSLTIMGKTNPLITIEKLTEKIIALEQNAIGGIV